MTPEETGYVDCNRPMRNVNLVDINRVSLKSCLKDEQIKYGRTDFTS